MTPEALAKSGSEHAHQRALFARIAQHCNTFPNFGKDDPFCQKLNMLFAINNAVGRNSAIHGARNKAEGVKAGVWDLFLPVPITKFKSGFGGNVTCYGLFIEMKEPGRRNHANGGCSDEQVIFGNNVRAQGYAATVCYTWEEAYLVVLRYLSEASA